MDESRRTRGASLLYLIFFLSGAAGLGYELVWTRMFAPGLGHEVPGMLAVVTAFFAGFALGAWALDGPVSRSRNPGRWYAGLELVIGIWGCLSAFLIPWANEQVASLIGVQPGPLRHWTIAFVIPLLILLPSTAAMGATLPAMDRLFSRLRAEGRWIGGLYAANTSGAVAGTLAATFILAPALGFRLTVYLLAALNLVCAAAVAACSTDLPDQPGTPTRQPSTLSARLGATLFMTGLLGIGYEVLGVRVMAQVNENTVYSFASALAVYLLGTALGGAAYQRYGRHAGSDRPLALLLPAVSCACLLGIVALSGAGTMYESCRTLLGGGFAGSVGAEMILALLVFLAPSMCMGAVFSHLAQSARGERGGVGIALALNTLGGAAAPALFGVWLLPLLGAKAALIALAVAYVLLIPEPNRLAAAALCLAVPTYFFTSLIHVEPLPGGHMLAYREGVMAAVAVVTDRAEDRLLKVNNRFYMGGTASAFAERRMAHIPLLLHPNPRRALFLGLGTGITFWAAAYHPDLRAEGVELVPEVVDVLPLFKEAGDEERGRSRLSVITADARRYARATQTRYDVIVADLFHPARDGSGALYTLEHFRAIRARLAPGGLFCQWLPIYQMDERMLRVIIRTFLAVFPEARAYIAHFNVATPALALVGTMAPSDYPADWFQMRVRNGDLAGALSLAGLPDGLSLFGCLVAGREDLFRYAESAPLNTDDRPVVTFGAPVFTYAKDQAPYATLQAVLKACRPRAEDIIQLADAGFKLRLAAYLTARNVYMRAEILRAEGKEPEAVNAYLASVRASRDFRTAYARVLVMAQEEASSDPDSARKLLSSLMAADPSRPEARDLLSRLPVR